MRRWPHEYEISSTTPTTPRTLMLKVNSSFITPFDREDIYRLASKLDDCMDLMESAADLIVLYRLGDLPDGISAQVQVLARMSELTADATPRLRAMGDLSEYWNEISRLENEADQAYRRLVAEVFNNGKDAITVLKLKEVIDELEAAADAFETAAHTVESIAVSTRSRASRSRSPEVRGPAGCADCRCLGNGFQLHERVS
jgi:predicted phosphate transport protein (TIGR00153 family)